MEPQRIALLPKLCAVPSLLPLLQQAQSRKGRGVVLQEAARWLAWRMRNEGSRFSWSP